MAAKPKIARSTAIIATPGLEIPQAMRDAVEQNLKQAHAAYEQLTDFVTKAMGGLDGRDALKSHDRWLQGGARPRRSSVEAECRVAFALVDKITKAQNFQEILTLQTRFAQDQMQAFAAQTQEFHKLIGDAVLNAGRR